MLSAVIELAGLRVAKTISVPPAPQEVLIRPDGQLAYVSCDKSHQVAAIKISDWSVKLIEGQTRGGRAGVGEMILRLHLCRQIEERAPGSLVNEVIDPRPFCS
jgi:hypothetical protein